jgi:hypothetical protein
MILIIAELGEVFEDVAFHGWELEKNKPKKERKGGLL